MRGILGGSLVLTAFVSFTSACATDDELLAEDEQEVLVGAFAARFDDTVRGGGVVAQGASFAGREDLIANTAVNVTIAGIPAGATVQRALLYWEISGGSDTTATLNANPVTGIAVGTAGETCWGTGVNNAVFRADVTALVPGNGVYLIGGLPSSVVATGADTNGVSLVVTYQNATSGSRRRIMIRDGAITSSGNGEIVSDTFAAIAAPLASAGQFHLVAGDGQTFADGAVIFNGVTLGTNQFPGSDGSLWDTNTYNVTVPAALASATWSSQTLSDCLSYGAAVLDYTVAVCGDGARTGGEACDQGNTTNGDGCAATCDVETGWSCTGTPSVCTPICGDGIRAGAEQCDQGNTTNGDGCSATCTIEPGFTCTGSPSVCTAVCGDGIRTGAEQCDQGNTTNGDGCSSTCTVEPGFMCTGSPSVCMTSCGDGIRAGSEACDDGGVTSGDGCSAVCALEPGWTCVGSAPSVCTTTCGDGVIAGTEVCDDGGTTAGDGCSATCTVESGWTCAGAPSTCMTICGDGIVAGAEACDDSGTAGGDGCSATCTVEQGWTCTGSPSTCMTTCGDGVIAGTETCDDGDAIGGDGCSTACAIEPGWSCTGAPSVCTTSCGDGVIAGSETCDDSNTAAGDGCSTSCAIEPGWTCTGAPSACDEICGDGMIVGTEACDDGGTSAADGCSATCTIEPGWSCTGAPSVCTANCGDGQLAGSEGCDDGNTAGNDGCSSACQIEPGWMCIGSPSGCLPVCGDGMITGTEACDDGNAASGDGCSQMCAVEDGWLCNGATPTDCQELSVAGGGCSSSSGSNGLPVAAALLLLIAAGRRRRRTVAVLGAVVAIAWASAPAMAQTVPGDAAYSAERFQLSMDRDGVLGTEAARTSGNLVLDVGLSLGYANDPVTVRSGNDHVRVASLVHDRYGGDLVVSLGIGSRLELGLAAPLILSQSHSLGTLMTSNGDLSSLGFGDLALTPKVALLRGAVDLALAATVTLPTSGGNSYFGEDGVTFAPTLLIGHTAGALRLLANLGYRARGEKAMAGLVVDDELLARAGLGYLVGRADLMVEAAFATAASDPTYNVNYGEVRIGAGVDLAPSVRLFGAAGVGLASGYGTPDWRALVGVWFGAGKATGHVEAPKVVDRDGDGIYDDVDKCVTEPETKNGFEDDDGCPDNPDADGDGILVPADKCPTEPETKNNFQDDDGCPDTVPDADGDGLSDAIDKCPNNAEDKDGFEDDDGCPDEDNDKDGVVDTSDRCPMVAGIIENVGCPDTDRDTDTVVDRLDNCPDEPGTVKNHGCKDKQLVVFTGGSIELLDIVNFKTNKAIIDKRSFKLLRNVASVVVAHPEIQKVTVGGHTDDQGDDAYNKDLSQRRAQAVVDFLITSGVKADVLVPIGYGEEKPLQDNKTAKGRAANRRVEFKVTSGDPTAPAPTP